MRDVHNAFEHDEHINSQHAECRCSRRYACHCSVRINKATRIYIIIIIICCVVRERNFTPIVRTFVDEIFGTEGDAQLSGRLASVRNLITSPRHNAARLLAGTENRRVTSVVRACAASESAQPIRCHMSAHGFIRYAHMSTHTRCK